MEEAQDFYIIAVYTAHCTVKNQDYIIPIINPDYTAKSGIRIILRPSSYLYRQIKDQLEAQDIELDYTEVNEYILNYPINIGKWIICDNDTASNIIDCIRAGSTAYKESCLSVELKINTLVLSATPCQPSLEETVHDIWYYCVEISYSLELYSILCKGNYIYSSLKYQKAAIKSLISLIRNDFNRKIDNYFDRPFSELSKIDVESRIEDKGYVYNCILHYPEINMSRTLQTISEISNFFHGFAISNSYGCCFASILDVEGYGIIDITGKIVLETGYEYISPFKLITSGNKTKYDIYSYIKKEDNQYHPFLIRVNGKDYSAYFLSNSYDKVFTGKNFDLVFKQFINEDEYEEVFKYSSSIVSVFKDLQLVNDYEDIKNIDETSKEDYYLITKAEYKKKSNGRNEAIGVFMLNDYGCLVEIIKLDGYNHAIQHLTDKFWIIWNDDAYNSGWKASEANLDMEKECTYRDDMSGQMIDNSQDAMIYHEDKGIISSAGEYQSYDTANYNSEEVLILYSGRYSEYYNDKGDREIDYEQDDYCMCINMEGDSFTTRTEDEFIQRYGGW